MTAFHSVRFRHLLLAATILSSPLLVIAPSPAAAQGIAISVQVAPPELPVYDQPPIPDAGYIWTPGYWAWTDSVGYYWVPGTWVQPPAVAVLWTPPYWAWLGGSYHFHEGYWGPHVGYYGGVDYGYGYGGEGYQGGRWQNNSFVYNKTVNNFGSVHIANVYNRPVTVTNHSEVSFAGGQGGLRTAPSAADRIAARDHHVPMTAEQTSHISAAAKLPDLAAKQNGGHPAIVATARPAQFEGAGVVHGAPGGSNAHAGAAPAAMPSTAQVKPGPEQPSEHAATPPAGPGAPMEHGAVPPPAHANAPPADHGMPPAGHAVGPQMHEAVPPAAHAAAPPAQHEGPAPHEGPVPAMHAVTPPVHEAPAAHAAMPPPHEAPAPAMHAVAPPAAHEAPAPAAHVAAPPPPHEAARPVEQHSAAPSPPPREPVQQHAAAQPPPAPHPAPAHAGPPEEKKEH